MTSWLRTRPRAESFFFAVLVLLMVAPLTLTMLLILVPKDTPWARWLTHPWLRNGTLAGNIPEPSPVSFSWPALRRGTYQESLATLFNDHYAGREMMVRWTNEAWFRLFNLPSTKATDRVVGRHGWLFEKRYLQEYFLQRVAKKDLEPMVDDIKKLQDICRARNMGFLMVVTPSKAATCPEEAPEGWDRRYDPRPRAYDQVMELFREKDVICVDGVAIMRAKGRSRSLFPIGGIHWTAPVALETANAMIAELQRQGMDVQKSMVSRSLAQDPHGVAESDLLDLMNLAIPWHYSYDVIEPHVVYTSSESKPSVVIVGGSFTNALGSFWSASRQFSSIRCYFYYKLGTIDYRRGSMEMVFGSPRTVHFDRDIFHANCLVLELNEQQLTNPDNHVKNFVRDALTYWSGKTR